LDVAATLFHLYSLIRQSVSDILAFLRHPLRSRTNCVSFFVVVVCLLQYFPFSFSLFFMHQQFVMGCERCSRLIQFLPEEENKIIFAFAGCESEYLTL
jgi:hypothetical protein